MSDENFKLIEFDAVVMPAVPIVAPPMSLLDDDDEYNRVNLLLLRNPTVANVLDGCAATVPCHRAGETPVGLVIMGRHGSDRRVLAIAGAVEALFPH